MQGKLTITFDEFGEVRSNATGFTGSACSAATEQILGNLGMKRQQEDRKPEYNQVQGAKGSSEVSHRW